MSQLLLSCERRLIAAVMVGAALVTSVAHAQGSQPRSQAPAGLQWQWMNEANFDTAWARNESATAAEKEQASSIWSKERSEARKEPDGSIADASFVLIKEIAFQGSRDVFSIYSRAGYGCEMPPGGSAGSNQMYAKCPLRVIKTSNGKTFSKDFSGYCYLNLDTKDQPRSRFHTEVGVDEKAGKVYFRTIQHGRSVPECQRAIDIAA